MQYLAPLFRIHLLVIFLFAAWQLPAQTEAEANNDVLVLEHIKKPDRTRIITKHQTIRYPVYSGRKLRHNQGRIVAIGDSTLELSQRKVAETHTLELTQVPYFYVVRKGWLSAAKVILIINAVLTLIAAIFFAIFVAAFGGGPLAIAFFFLTLLGFFTSPFTWIGAIMHYFSRKKIWLNRWTYNRMIRRRVTKTVIVKKPKSQK